MATDPEKYDPTLLAILQNEGKVAPFLDVILGFLYRRTDFFRIMKSETDRLGFPPGVAYKLLENIFKKYEAQADRDTKRAEEMKRGRENTHAVNEIGKETVQNTAQESTHNDSNVGNTTETTEAAVATSSISQQEKEDTRMETDTNNEVDSVSKECPEKNDSAPSSSSGCDDEKEEDPEIARKRRNLQANPLTYNGAELEAYFWSQTITEADVRVKVPKSIVKGKQVKVSIQKKRIIVSQQAADGSWPDIINNELSWEVNTEESMWTLSPGEFVHINLEKKQERWWENVFVDEPKINTRKIDCSRPMTDLDDEAQAKIEEMMFNQRQKQLGLPQSHEQKTHEMLRKAWDADGSPFKGQPFDPSRFSVDPSGVVNFKDS